MAKPLAVTASLSDAAGTAIFSDSCALGCAEAEGAGDCLAGAVFSV